jgi:peptidoglycan/xylan/chitin deacetylase (PgdA/CDA1 family)
MTSFRPLFCALLVAVAPAAGLRAQAASKPLQVAFTFDDLPAHGPLPPGEARPQVVTDILATLKREKMPPTYGFVNGFRLEKYPYQVHILQAWVRAGQPLGNHTYDHPELDKTPAAEYVDDIAENEPVLKKVDPDGDWHWFRYPYLQEGETAAKREAVRGWLTAHHYRVAEVTLDFEDYMWNDTYGRCAALPDTPARAKAIQSLHDTYLSTANTYINYGRELSQRLYKRDIPYVLLLHVGAFDAKMLPELIALFRARGFSFVTLPQAQADPAYAEDAGIGFPGGGLLTEMVATQRKVPIPNATEPEKLLDAMCR